MIQNTSKEAYAKVIPSLGQKQREVLNIISDNPCISNLEIAQILRKPINSITPRVYEIRSLGLVEDAGVKTCPITRRKVHCWRLRNDQMPLFAA